MFRHLLLASLLASIAITGCSRKSETHDPDQPTDQTPQTETEVIEEVIVTEPDSSDPNSDDAGGSGSDDSAATGNDSAESPNSEGQLICNAKWFEWVNEQLMSKYSEAIAEQYPDGMPSVGSPEWFMAADKLTGGDGAHGPDGGSDEWCFMMQQRLGNND
ncbi:hypothetical protein [Microbulbifer hydrolyticus]|uniref:Secreted protein n=1 Tax=Microbulbifer hydrolyticus TaxID=48074 RepID=A0A6P1T7H5_9GAMM|nr:hypothetical protein [Microbulbifer hydrolyticus]MBB5210864.1 hypothetical protein [Microbulbifer hydrolyticus]QHQ38708.1 hypothetical protein GTQ55_06700 [Microbulbifer hydrolyticus]